MSSSNVGTRFIGVEHVHYPGYISSASTVTEGASTRSSAATSAPIESGTRSKPLSSASLVRKTARHTCIPP